MIDRSNLQGCWFKLLNRINSRSPLFIDRITGVSDQVIIGTHQSFVMADEDFVIIEDPLRNFHIEKGITAIIKRDLTSLKKGAKITVDDFLDDENTKILTSGLAPGGWINKKDLIIDVDLSKFRLKTYIECCLEFGIDWQYRNSHFLGKAIDQLGKNLSSVGVVFDNFNNSLNYKGGTIWGIYVTDKEYPKESYKLQVVDKIYFDSLKPYFDLSTFRMYKEGLKSVFGKDFNELNIASDMKKWSIIKTIKYIADREYIQTIDSKYIDLRFLKLVVDDNVKEKSTGQTEDVEASEVLGKASKKLVDIPYINTGEVTYNDPFAEMIELHKQKTHRRRVKGADYTEDGKIIDPTPEQINKMLGSAKEELNESFNNQLIWGNAGTMEFMKVPGLQEEIDKTNLSKIGIVKPRDDRKPKNYLDGSTQLIEEEKAHIWDLGSNPIQSPMLNMEAADNNGLTSEELHKLHQLHEEQEREAFIQELTKENEGLDYNPDTDSMEKNRWF